MQQRNFVGTDLQQRIERNYNLWEDMERRGECNTPSYYETVRNLIHLLYLYYKHHTERAHEQQPTRYCSLFPEELYTELHERVVGVLPDSGDAGR